jgi:hypothetical protein
VLIDKINECRRVASRGDPSKAMADLEALGAEVSTEWEREAYIRARRAIQEMQDPTFYGVSR